MVNSEQNPEHFASLSAICASQQKLNSSNVVWKIIISFQTSAPSPSFSFLRSNMVPKT